MPRLFPYVLALLICALAPAGAAAAPTIDGIFPTGATPLSGKPGYLTLGPDGNIWVADSGNNRVVAMTPGGTQVFTFNGTGQESSIPFDRPFDVAFSGSSVFVSDLWNNRIVELR